MHQALLWLIVTICINNCSAACPSPFVQLSGGRCAYWNSSYSVNWCRAAEICLGIGGELAIDLDLIRAARSQLKPTYSFIGLTDLLIERGTNKTGWQLTNGSFAQLDDADWNGGPQNSQNADDFGVLNNAGVSDSVSFHSRPFLCQPLVTPNSKMFKPVSFLRLGNISPDYCSTEVTGLKLQLECTSRCAVRWQCRAALHNAVEGRCRMLDFTDASVGDAIELDPNWTKMVKRY